MLTIKAVAQGVLSQVRIFGGSIGLSVSTILYNQKAQNSLRGILSPDELQLLHKSPASIINLSLPQQLAVRGVFAGSFNQDFRVCTYIAAICVLVSLLGYQRNPMDIYTRKKAHESYIQANRMIRDTPSRRGRPI